MSVVIKNLTKVYGEQKAVDNISFEIGKGSVVGFLGPNGAGKSTTMKIATCFLQPTSGTVEILGLDVEDNPREIKRNVGYLPENNPLYYDMYLHEYLNFAGKSYGIRGSSLKSRVEEIIVTCGLVPEQNKKISALSKGYKQRVGLAQALIHNPSVLILDEPTTGLDPNQVVEIRSLIKKLSEEKTVIFSTHIMGEVQAVCDRAIIINKGKIVADDSIENLHHKTENTVIKVEFSSIIDTTVIEEIGSVVKSRRDENILILETNNEQDVRSEIFALASKHNLPLVGLSKTESSLEDVFRNLTQPE